MNNFTITPHAEKRMAQRGFRRADVYLALERGQYIYAHETLFVFLGRRQLAELGNLAERLEGFTLVLDPRTNAVLTCYRNRKLTKRIRYRPRRCRHYWN